MPGRTSSCSLVAEFRSTKAALDAAPKACGNVFVADEVCPFAEAPRDRNSPTINRVTKLVFETWRPPRLSVFFLVFRGAVSRLGCVGFRHILAIFGLSVEPAGAVVKNARIKVHPNRAGTRSSWRSGRSGGSRRSGSLLAAAAGNTDAPTTSATTNTATLNRLRDLFIQLSLSVAVRAELPPRSIEVRQGGAGGSAVGIFAKRSTVAPKYGNTEFSACILWGCATGSRSLRAMRLRIKQLGHPDTAPLVPRIAKRRRSLYLHPFPSSTDHHPWSGWGGSSHHHGSAAPAQCLAIWG
jgi:hypothetical protein